MSLLQCLQEVEVLLGSLGFGVGVEGGVNDFTQTGPQFFANPNDVVSPPTVFKGNNYKQICQVRENAHEYATLYDTEKKIPVYSAYQFKGVMGCKRLTKWYIEPQLEQITNSKEMAPESSVTSIQNQAVNKDYYKSGYDRGHLAHVYHSKSQSCFLTNTAPQHCSFNKGQWKETEIKVADILNKSCLPNSAFIVTGVVPGYIEPPLKNRVIIPSHFWTAYCCLDNNFIVIDSNDKSAELIRDHFYWPRMGADIEEYVKNFGHNHLLPIRCLVRMPVDTDSPGASQR
ncbi:endonuclease domain-containing 1 protein-like [Pygocentrus nattereri]|uniref:endonuclease domain-containing 1 protein-like n=1 Tax=Pygocentrus nattereri TaxID=42514 RepID=UPI001891A281|nr:endonuclease domain-containing 1 protein-like [Pygocentrus nattereri]